MSYGFSIYDQEGGLVASESARTLHYIGRATYQSYTGDSTYGYMVVFTINSPGGEPLPFIEYDLSESLPSAVKSVALVSGSTYSITIVTKKTPTSVNVFAFAPLASQAPSSNHGIRIYGADGSINFSSPDKPMVLDFIARQPKVSQGVGNPDGNVFSYSGGLTYNITIPTMSRPAFASSGGGGEMLFMEAMNIPHGEYEYGFYPKSSYLRWDPVIFHLIYPAVDNISVFRRTTGEAILGIDISRYDN